MSTHDSAESALAARAVAIIEDAREARGWSFRRAAAETPGISEGWWRSIVRGERSVAVGVTAPVPRDPRNLTRMGAAVGVEREVREVLGLEIPDRLIARGPDDDPDLEATLRTPPEEYHLLTPEGRAYIDAMVRRLAREEQERLGSGSDGQN